LARLLATEDLLIEHKNVTTASFNVQTRVLTLPRWERATNNILNLLVSHEVAHALFTPNEDWRKKTNIPQGFINVTEDVRIEVLMKRKYAGLPKTFYRGYQELYDQDFFGIEDEDISAMNIADRVNLHFKIGNFVKVPFTDAEMVVVKQCADAVTFDDAIAAAEALYALHEKQKEEQKSDEEVSAKQDSGEDPGDSGDGGKDEQQEMEPNSGDSEESSGQEPGDEEESEEQKETDGVEDDEQPKEGGDSAANLSDEVTTMDNFNDNLEDLIPKNSFSNPQYLSFPKFSSEDYIGSNSDIHNYIQESFARQIQYMEESMGDRSNSFVETAFGVHRTAYAEFKRSIQSEVNYMVKEFECKKSAAAYARASTSRTGVLDCTKLHTYKYNEDLFRKVTTLPEGKNHGLLFVLDWSGSMCDIMEDTMKQLISLVMFCDKVNIPFDVYAFTNEWNRYVSNPKELEVANELYIGEGFSMMNILTSKVNRKELQRQMETMYMIARSYSTRSMDIVPARVSLSGTPLNEALITLREILPDFKERNGVEKAHVMVLTDGEASMMRYTREYESYDGDTRLSVGRMNSDNFYIRNRKTGTVRKVERTLGSVTTTILEDLRTQFPESTFTGFRILEQRGGWFIRQACNYDDNILSTWKKEKSIAITNFVGYNKYYIVSSNSIQESSEFDVASGATKAKIKSAFTKSLKGKKNNKKILGDFIGLIA
ncbi:MAG: peptidase, partial [Candidatus Thorarchaeota archaeon]